MIPGKKYTPEDLLAIAWNRKWLLVLPLVIGSVASYVWAHYQPTVYRSETTILVVPQRVPENYVRSTVSASLSDRLQSISQQILSRTRLESIIQDFQLYPEQRRTLFMEDVVDMMRRAINVQVVKGDAFRIAYLANDPRRAMQVTERLASLFIDESLRDREILADSTNQFLETQLQEARQHLIEHEKKLEDYNRAHAGELPTQMTSNLQAMNGLQMQLQQLVDSINRDRDLRINLQRQLDDLSAQQALLTSSIPADAASGVVLDPGAMKPLVSNATTAQLNDARRQLQEMQLRLKDLHPDLIRQRRVVEDLEAKAAREAAAAAAELARPTVPGQETAPIIADNPNSPARRIKGSRDDIDSLDRQIASKAVDETRLKDLIESYRQRIEATPTRESELTELTRDYGTMQQNYRNLLAKDEEAKVAANLERRQIGEQFKVLDPARIPERPFSPDRQRIVLAGALLGLALGVGLAALLEYRDTSLKTDQDVVTALSLPVLAIVPVMRSAAEQRRERRRKVLVSVASAATFVVSVAVVLFLVWKLNF